MGGEIRGANAAAAVALSYGRDTTGSNSIHLLNYSMKLKQDGQKMSSLHTPPPPPPCPAPPKGRQSPATPWGTVVKWQSPTPPLGNRTTTGVGENWLARGGGGSRWSPFPGPPPPLLGSRDGALKKVIDGGK